MILVKSNNQKGGGCTDTDNVVRQTSKFGHSHVTHIAHKVTCWGCSAPQKLEVDKYELARYIDWGFG